VVDKTVTGTGSAGDPARSSTDLAGRSIRHYLVERELGRGGMGIVYLARDTRLEREVALKVLPDQVAADPARLARFRREAKLLASMNHPNIATIHGLEEIGDGRQAIIMELLEGETLDARLRREPLPLTQALEICEQIAVAVGQAHERGVIHRDLKPGNTFLAPDGVVKVLDFGLARQSQDLDETASPHGLSESSLGSPQLESLPFAGTPGYMSPEQIRGEPDDHRTDIFAFGSILYECVAGRPAFDGAFAHERAAGTLGPGPDWSLWPDHVPPQMRDLASRCLERDRERRLADLREARDMLRVARGLAIAPPAAAPIQGLLQSATSFIGRSREIAEVQRALQRTNLLTLTGAGGCGKTRLAQEVARRVAPAFPDGAAFVDLAPILDAQRIPLEVGTALGLREQHGKPMIDLLVDRLREKRFLLVLDNCEHVLEACATLASRLLRVCFGLRILATSREALSAAGEQEVAVRPLEIPREGEPIGSKSSEAVQLFVERAKLVQSGFEVTAENGPAIADICRCVDGIPLGIELAAARVKVLAPSQISARLKRDLKLLSSGSPSSSTRHQALEGTIRWSYDQLADQQRKTFRALSVFAGGWTLEAAEGILGSSADSFDTLDDLTQLVNKSLLMVERLEAGEVRYRMLEPIRQFAAEELRAAREESGARARHVDYFLAWVQEIKPHLDGREPFSWLARLDADRENLLAAARYCEEVAGGTEKALRLLTGLDRFWIRRGHFGLAQAALDQALALPGAEAPTIDRAEALCTAASVACIRGDPRSVAFFEESLALCRSLGQKRLAARVLNGLGVCAIDRADRTAAIQHLEESLALGREIGDVIATATAVGNLGVIAFLAGDYERARSLFEEGVQKYRSVQDTGAQMSYLGGVSRSSVFLGDIPRARVALLETIPLIAKLGDKRNTATTLLTAGLLAVKIGDPRAAARFLAAGEALRATFAATAALFAPADQKMQDTAVAAIRETLGPAGLEAAWSEGRHLDFHASLRAIDEFARSLEGG
jgi:predicted ATPase/predicted Ser/Thr protein kinase